MASASHSKQLCASRRYDQDADGYKVISVILDFGWGYSVIAQIRKKPGMLLRMRI